MTSPPTTPTPPSRDRQVDLRATATVAAYLGIIGLVLYGALIGWRLLSFVLLPFAIAVLLTALLEPVATFLKRRLRLPGAVAALVTVLGTLGIIAAVVLVIAPQIVNQTSTMVGQVEEGIAKIPGVLRDLGVKDADLQNAIQSGTDNLKEDFGSIAGRVGSGVLSVASLVTSVVGGMLLVLMMLIYLLMDGDGFWRGCMRFVPIERREGWHEGGVRAWDTLKMFIRSQVMVSAIYTIGVGIGLWIVGVPLWLPLGVMTFVLSLIPTIGAILAGVIAALVALSTNGVSGFLWAIAIATIVQQVEGNILYPVLIGRSLSLHPLAVLLGVGAGTAVLGVVGAFLATPIMAAVASGMGWLGEPSPGTEEGLPPDGDAPHPTCPQPPRGEPVAGRGLPKGRRSCRRARRPAAGPSSVPRSRERRPRGVLSGV